MKIRSRTALAAVTAGTVALGTVTAVAAAPSTGTAAPVAAAKATPAQPGDFNGDGRRDIAAASPQGTMNGVGLAGFITIVYSRANGPDVAGRQVVTAKSLGLAVPRYFGGAMASADFDRDGYADLVIATGEGAKKQIVIAHGGPKGVTSRKTIQKVPYAEAFTAGDINGNGGADLIVTTSKAHYWTFHDLRDRPKPGVKTAVKTMEGGLFPPVIGDFNGDRHGDLALAVGKDNGDGDTIPDWGHLRLGGPKGLGAPKVYTTKGQGLGMTAAAGDVNGDGRADLVQANWRNQRQLIVRAGTKTGLGPAKAVQIGKGDFGDTVAVRDVNGDGRADVAAGIPDATVGGKGSAGRVAVLYGTKSGLTATGALVFDQNTPGVPGAAGESHLLGVDLSLADLDGDRLADLVTGPQNDGDGDTAEGRIYVLRGSRTGTTLTGITTFTTKDLKLHGRHAQLSGILLH